MIGTHWNLDKNGIQEQNLQIKKGVRPSTVTVEYMNTTKTKVMINLLKQEIKICKTHISIVIHYLFWGEPTLYKIKHKKKKKEGGVLEKYWLLKRIMKI